MDKLVRSIPEEAFRLLSAEARRLGLDVSSYIRMVLVAKADELKGKNETPHF